MFGRLNRPLWTLFPNYEDSRLDSEQARSGRAADGGLRAALLAVRRRKSASESRHRRHSSPITIQRNKLGPRRLPNSAGRAPDGRHGQRKSVSDQGERLQRA